MDSFNNCSRYGFRFDRLDKRITKQCTPDAYYQRWMKKYAGIFGENSTTETVIEWDLRCKKSLREIFAASTFFVEAQNDLKMRCYASYYFCLYYSLFHAILAVILMDPNTSLSSILKIMHRNLISIFVGSFANSKKDILDSRIRDQFYDLQYRREYYSYVTPINNLFNYEKDLAELKETVQDCFQLAAFHSLMIEKSHDKHLSEIRRIQTEDELYDFITLFDSMFAKRTKDKRIKSIDPAAENLKNEIIEYGSRPEYIALELDHQFDEIHTYDGFYKDESKSNEAIKVDEIYSLVYQSINGTCGMNA